MPRQHKADEAAGTKARRRRRSHGPASGSAAAGPPERPQPAPVRAGAAARPLRRPAPAEPEKPKVPFSPSSSSTSTSRTPTPWNITWPAAGTKPPGAPCRHHGRRPHQARRGLRPARPRRRGLPHGHEVELPGQGHRQARLPRRERRRERAGHLQGPPYPREGPAPAAGRRDPHLLGDPEQARLHLPARRVHPRVPAPRSRGERSRREGFHRRKILRQGFPASTSPWSAARAPTSAAKRPACFRRSRAAAVIPRSSRPSRRSRPVQGPDHREQRRDHRRRRSHREARRGLAQAMGHGKKPRLQDLLPRGRGEKARRLRSAAGHHHARDRSNVRRRHGATKAATSRP